jgi:S-adenosylmethionine synthetase
MSAAAAVSQFQFHCTLAANTPVADRPHAAAQLLAGAILDALRTLDPRSRVACDVHSDARTLTLRGQVCKAAPPQPPQDLLQPEEPVLDYVI